MQFFWPAAHSDLGWNNATNDVFLLYFLTTFESNKSNHHHCGRDAGYALYPIMSKKSIVTSVYQLCLSAFTNFISLCRLGFTMPRCNYFSIQDWVRIHSGTGKWVQFTLRMWKCKHFTRIIQGCNEKQLAGGTNITSSRETWSSWYLNA